MPVSASQIAAFLGCTLVGPDLEVKGVTSIDSLQRDCLVFAARYDPAASDRINAVPGLLALVSPDYAERLTAAHIVSERPRFDFARAAQRFFAPRRASGIAATAIIAASAEIGADVSIGNYCVIGENVTIGDRTEIREHVVIRDSCVVGSDCVIKSNSVIGEEGFGFEFDDAGTPTRLPHFGRVIIGNGVEIGALNVIARGTLDATVIGDGVKTDDHVFIAHNVSIGDNTVIIAGAEISGSVRIGRNVWIAPQATLIQKITIGDNALVGIGAVVTRSVAANMVVAGNPAKELRSR